MNLAVESIMIGVEAFTSEHSMSESILNIPSTFKRVR